jgi:hypothetical protein
MSVSPRPQERLAEVLQEILALSNSGRTSQPASEGDDSNELFDAQSVKEPQPTEEGEIN